jgi:hypothetical protein
MGMKIVMRRYKTRVLPRKSHLKLLNPGTTQMMTEELRYYSEEF